MSVDHATQDGTATIGDDDYVSSSGTQYWPTGGSNIRFSIYRAKKDAVAESDEYFEGKLSNASPGVIITDDIVMATLLNDDGASIVQNQEAGGIGIQHDFQTQEIEICDGKDNDGDGMIDEGL